MHPKHFIPIPHQINISNHKHHSTKKRPTSTAPHYTNKHNHNSKKLPPNNHNTTTTRTPKTQNHQLFQTIVTSYNFSTHYRFGASGTGPSVQRCPPRAAHVPRSNILSHVRGFRPFSSKNCRRNLRDLRQISV